MTTRIPVCFSCNLQLESLSNQWFLDIIPGLDPKSLADLGEAARRDPDALPPRNLLEKTANWVYHGVTKIGGGNALFALKAGILSSETFPS